MDIQYETQRLDHLGLPPLKWSLSGSYNEHTEENMRKPTQFTEEYKRSAVAKAQASRNVTQTARELGISSKSLYRWMKGYAEPLDVETASDKALAKRVRELERQLAIREGQIDVLKKAIGIVSEPGKNGS